MKKNQAGSALIISIITMMILIVIAIYLLEKIVPFSRDMKGIENGNISYYRANTALNEALLSMSGSDPSIQGSSGTTTGGSGSLYQITANGTVLPMPGYGNSEYDRNWSILAPGKPIQLVLNSTPPVDWITGTHFVFRIPDLNQDGTFNETLSGSTTPIINWSLSASGESLQAQGTQIIASNINSSHIILGDRLGFNLGNTTSTFSVFYTSKCITPVICTLKLSLVNPLILTTGGHTPYLEYQVYLDQAIPLQTAIIQTQGYGGGFRKDIQQFVEQLTTSEALDFTIFQ